MVRREFETMMSVKSILEETGALNHKLHGETDLPPSITPKLRVQMVTLVKRLCEADDLVGS